MKRPLQEHNFSVEHNGTRHQAKYTADKGAVIVYYGNVTIQGTYGRLLAKDEAILLLKEHLVQKD